MVWFWLLLACASSSGVEPMVEPAGDPFATRAPVASLSSDALGADIPPEAPSPTPLTEAQAARAD